MSRSALAWSYAVYVIALEAILWIGSGYAVLFHGRSPVWFLAAAGLSFCVIRPENWRLLFGGKRDE